jgi:hypothetical protein
VILRVSARLTALGSLCVLLSCRPSAQVGPGNDDQAAPGQEQNVHSFFLQANLDTFIGRSVGEFDAALPLRYHDVYPLDEPPGKLIGFALKFANGYVVDVFCYDLTHVQRFSEQRQWDFATFLREKISKVGVRYFKKG